VNEELWEQKQVRRHCVLTMPRVPWKKNALLGYVPFPGILGSMFPRQMCSWDTTCQSHGRSRWRGGRDSFTFFHEVVKPFYVDGRHSCALGVCVGLGR